MNRLIIFLAIALTALLSGVMISCEEDNAADPISDSIIFKGITLTDNNGWAIKNDPDDWKLEEKWTGKENSLFAEKNMNSCGNENMEYIIRPSYLNPCSQSFAISFTKPAGSRFSFRIVDRHYNILIAQDSVFSNGLAIDVQGFGIKNDTVRMYYKFLGPSCELKGHGDIKIE